MLRALVVDDDERYLQAMCEVLILVGLDAIGVGREEEALELAPTGFDLVVSDWEMPNGGGGRILEGNICLPVIIASGRLNDPGDSYQQMFLTAGAIATVRKSFLGEDLPPAVRTALANLQPLRAGDRAAVNCYQCLCQAPATLGREEPLIAGFYGPRYTLGRMVWSAQATGTTFDLWEMVGGSGHWRCPKCHTNYAHVIAISDPEHGPQVFYYESEGA